jgi:phenylacetic acid degradation operon negative regulatory protein
MRARSLLFTVYGDSIRPHGGEIGMGSLIRLMAPLGFTPRAVRAAMARIARQGWLRTRRVGRRAYYSLTPEGAWRVEEGVRRVYRLEPEPWDGRWRLLTYAIPEGRRSIRDRLRRELTWLGLGPLSRSTWLTPRALAAPLAELVRAHGVDGHVAIFEAALVGPAHDRELVRRCWDLDAIAARYTAFMATTRRRAASLRLRLRRRAISDATCFSEKIRLVHEYRKFLFVDPGLPDALLPSGWPGRDAARLFRDVYRLLDGPAARFFQDSFDPPPGGNRRAAPTSP